MLSTWKDTWICRNVKGVPIIGYVTKELLKRGHKITWLAPEEDEMRIKNLWIKNAENLHKLPLIPKLNFLLAPIYFIRNSQLLLKSALKIISPELDGVVAYGREAIFAAEELRKRAGLPYIARILGANDFRFHFNNPFSFFTHYPERHYRRLNPLIFALDDDGTHPEKVMKRFGIKNYVTFPHPKRPKTKISKKVMREKLKIGEKDVVIGFVGRLTKLKGAHWLPYIFKNTLKNIPEEIKIRFLIIGDGPLQTKILKWKKLYPSQILWLGAIPYEEVQKLYRIMDIYIHLVTYGALTNPLIEAISQGIACVVLDTTEDPPYLLSRETAYLIPKSRIDLFSKALLKLILDKKERDKFAKNALRAAKSHITFKKRVEWETELIERAFS